jgi:hypothetical protein
MTDARPPDADLARERMGAMRAAFAEAAARAGGAVERDVLVAGDAVRLRFAGPALLPCIMPALAHLPAAVAREPSLVVEAWDSASTGVPLPEVIGPVEDYQVLNSGGAEPAGGIFATYPYAGAGLSVYDRRQSLGAYWVPDARRTPFETRAQPLRHVFDWWAVERGLQVVHGAAVGADGGCVLIAARGGSGKSTTAFACLLAGLRYVGDDYSLADVRGAVPFMHTLYSTGRLHGHNIDRFPGLEAHLANASRLAFEKGLFYLNDLYADRMTQALPLRAMLIPRVTGRPATAIVPASPAAALASLAPSTLLQLSAARADSLRRMASLVRAVPCYTLELGTAMQGVVDAIRELIRTLDPAVPTATVRSP